MKSQIRFHGFDPATSLLELTPREGESCLREEDIDSTDRPRRRFDCTDPAGRGELRDRTGLRHGRQSRRPGQRKGCVVGFDLAHAAGNMPLRLHDWGPDFAVWCSYKYLNGGPGCVGGCFVHERHARAWKLPRFAGWWGHDETDSLSDGPGVPTDAGRRRLATEQSSDSGAGPSASFDGNLRRSRNGASAAKSVLLTAYMEFLLQQHASENFSIITPREPNVNEERNFPSDCRAHGRDVLRSHGGSRE